MALMLVFFGWGVVRLLVLRFDAGDVYPPNSTLRGDPLGTKVFYAALNALPGLSVERSLRPLRSVGIEPMRAAAAAQDDPQTAVFCVGVEPSSWPFLFDPEAVARLEEILRRGGRVVLIFLPAPAQPTEAQLTSARTIGSTTPDPHHRRAPVAERIAALHRPPDLSLRWGIDFRRSEPNHRTTPPAVKPGASLAARPASVPVRAPGDFAGPLSAPDPGWPRLPAGAPADDDAANVSWHSAADFDVETVPAIANRWRGEFARNGHPVIVSRPFGELGGELVCASDSYFLSNEGLRKEPHPELLSALVGPSRRIIFDESHLGLNESPGMMTLARRYHLQGGVGVLLVLVALFVWRNVVHPAPPPAESARGETPGAITGRDAASGFLLILRRGVPVRHLAAECVARWQMAFEGAAGRVRVAVSGGGLVPAGTGAIERARAALDAEEARPARQRSPAAAYRAICAALRTRV